MDTNQKNTFTNIVSSTNWNLDHNDQNQQQQQQQIPMCSGLIWPNTFNNPLQIPSSSPPSSSGIISIPTAGPSSSSSSFLNDILGIQFEEEDGEQEEELGAMKEMMYKIAAMQPVDIDPASIRKPKRRNVRISDDPQSVAARHRRERISERIRILQRLVPGGTKMDTASMLDEAIRYVKFLKRQIRLLQLTAPSSSRSHQPNDCIGISGLVTAAAADGGGDSWPFGPNIVHGSVASAVATASMEITDGMGFGGMNHGQVGEGSSSSFNLHKIHHQCLNHAIKTQPRLKKKSMGIGNCYGCKYYLG